MFKTSCLQALCKSGICLCCGLYLQLYMWPWCRSLSLFKELSLWKCNIAVNNRRPGGITTSCGFCRWSMYFLQNKGRKQFTSNKFNILDPSTQIIYHHWPMICVEREDNYYSLFTRMHSALLGSTLNSRLSSLDLSPSRGHCVMFWSKTLLSQCLSPPSYING